MLLGVPLTELFWLALAIIIGGVITGVLAGLFGIGGGTVIVPVPRNRLDAGLGSKLSQQLSNR